MAKFYAKVTGEFIIEREVKVKLPLKANDKILDALSESSSNQLEKDLPIEYVEGITDKVDEYIITAFKHVESCTVIKDISASCSSKDISQIEMALFENFTEEVTDELFNIENVLQVRDFNIVDIDDIESDEDIRINYEEYSD